MRIDLLSHEDCKRKITELDEGHKFINCFIEANRVFLISQSHFERALSK